VTAPLPLLVPSPALTFKPVGGRYAPLENAVTLSFSAIHFPDGSAMTADDFAGAQALLSRRMAAGSGVDVWDGTARAWRPAGSVNLNQLTGVPLVPPKIGATAWEGVLVAAGQKDAAGVPQIQPAAAHFPQYRLRGVFRANRGGADASGLGPESGPLEFASAVAGARFGADLSPDADGATRVRIVLRDATARATGMLEIDTSAGNAVVTLANFDGLGSALATVTLQADGAIRIAPSAGRRVILAGDLEAEHIKYLPAGALTKQDLT
jgi:hypothetical protein